MGEWCLAGEVECSMGSCFEATSVHAGLDRECDQTRISLGQDASGIFPLSRFTPGDERRRRHAKGSLHAGLVKRMPSLESGRVLAQAGIRWHFSGHMHVARRIEYDGLVNLSVPSPVAYPGGYAPVTCGDGRVDCEFIRLKDAPGFNVANAAYKMQVRRADMAPAFHEALAAKEYSDFLNAHQKAVITLIYLGEDWPAGIGKAST